MIDLEFEPAWETPQQLRFITFEMRLWHPIKTWGSAIVGFVTDEVSPVYVANMCTPTVGFEVRSSSSKQVSNLAQNQKKIAWRKKIVFEFEFNVEIIFVCMAISHSFLHLSTLYSSS